MQIVIGGQFNTGYADAMDIGEGLAKDSSFGYIT